MALPDPVRNGRNSLLAAAETIRALLNDHTAKDAGAAV